MGNGEALKSIQAYRWVYPGGGWAGSATLLIFFNRRAYRVAMPAIQLWTIADLDTLPYDGVRYEILDGELIVNPPPHVRHADALGRLLFSLYEYCRAQPNVTAFTSPIGLRFSDHRYFEPDILVARLNEGPLPDMLDPKQALLVVEVLSPSSSARDRGRKREIYMEEGVAEYWVVDEANHSIERWLHGEQLPVVETGILLWSVAAGAVPMAIDLRTLFRH